MANKIIPRKHDLADYVEEISSTLLQDYMQIAKRVTEDPGTAGDQVEETWAQVLRSWLPSNFHVVTKGRIVGSDGKASPQIDVLVLWPTYPSFLRQKKYYMASGVAAAFECKLKFRRSHLRKLFETAVSLSEISEREYQERRNIKKSSGLNFSFEEYHRIFEYGLLAHSFDGNDPIRMSHEITTAMITLDAELVKHPKQMVDLICIQDIGSWVSEKYAISSHPIITENRYQMVYSQHPSSGYHCLTAEKWATGSSIHANFSPLGSFLARLYKKLSRIDSTLGPMARFFSHTLSTGQGGGYVPRIWRELHTPQELWELSKGARARNESLHADFEFLGF